MISSRTNPRIKEIRRLRQRSERERTGRFFVEGIHLVAAALQARAPVELLVVAPDLLTSPFARELLRTQWGSSSDRLEVTGEVFETLAFKEVAQGIGAVAGQRWERIEEVSPASGSYWVALDGVQYPGNLGTVLRTCDAVGCEGVLLLDHTTDPYDPAAARASMGAVFSQRLVRATWEQFVDWKARCGCRVVGTSPSAPTDYQGVCYCPPFVLLMGCERGGLGAERQAVCDQVVRIPMAGRCDSLNLAVSTSVVLYEAFNQHRLVPNGREGAP